MNILTAFSGEAVPKPSVVLVVVASRRSLTKIKAYQMITLAPSTGESRPEARARVPAARIMPRSGPVHSERRCGGRRECCEAVQEDSTNIVKT